MKLTKLPIPKIASTIKNTYLNIKDQRLGLGLVRLLLSVAIVFTHTHHAFGLRLTGAGVSIRAFFIISGFYMALIWQQKYQSKRAFYINRFLRIFPLYWLILGLILLKSIFLHLSINSWGHLAPIFKYLNLMKLDTIIYLILANVFIFGQDLIFHLRMVITTGHLQWTNQYFTLPPPPLHFFFLIPQAWTLAIELVFYLISPWIVRSSRIMMGLLAISMGMNWYLTNVGLHGEEWGHRFLPIELGFFVMGALAYRIWYKWGSEWFRENLVKLGVVLVFGYIILFNFVAVELHINQWCFFLLFVLVLPFMFKYSENSKIDRKLGELSYPVYISHIFISATMGMVPFVGKLKLNDNWSAIEILMVTLLFSIIINELVQKPIDNWRHKQVR